MASVADPRTARVAPKRWRVILAVVLTVVGAMRIAATYSELSETVDEVAHIGAGMEWLALGQYTFELKHPPLARIAAAAGPYMLGIRSQGQDNLWSEGRQVLFADGAYLRNLTAARLGILAFFFVAAFFIWRIGREAFGEDEALAAVACFTLLPPVLAHFGVATTDGPMLATFAAAIYAGMRWLVVPNVAQGVWLGVAVALAIVSKFSAIAYLGVTAILLAAARVWARPPMASAGTAVDSNHLANRAEWSWRQAIVSLTVAGLVAFITAWAVYRFSINTVRGIPIPLADVLKGLRDVALHNRLGHPVYFLGETRIQGVWYFFPVVLALKTPLPALLLGIVGFGVLALRGLRRRDWVPLVPIGIAVAILMVAMPSSINIGVRHVLPIYIALSLAVGVAWWWLWRRLTSSPARVALGIGVVVGSIGTATIHPDYLAYFNALGGREPARLVADSDLDWGQDLFRLRREVEARGVDTLIFAYIGTADLSPIVGVPVRYWNGWGRPAGWVAIMETWYRRGQAYQQRGQHAVDLHAMRWLDSAATATKVGKGIRLYHIPRIVGDSMTPR